MSVSHHLIFRSRPGRHLFALATAAVLLTACGGSGEPAAPATTATTDVATLAKITVSGSFGHTPDVSVPTPFVAPTLQTRVVTAGTGTTVADGDEVSVRFLGVDGASGQVFNSSFARQEPMRFLAGVDAQVLPGLAKSVTGAKVGSRLLVAVPPADGYGDAGMATLGVAPDDSLVLVVDVLAAKKVLTRAEGKAVPAKPGLPTVTLAENGEPTLTLPDTAPPKWQVISPLIVGSGALVHVGELITVHYVGVTWPGGKVFDSSWQRGQAAQWAVGGGKLIKGLDNATVGQRTGSQVLTIVPPGKGYGAQGNPTQGIKPTDTLVYVIDILDAGDGSNTGVSATASAAVTPTSSTSGP